MDIIAIITAILTLVAGIGVFLIACTTMSSNLESASSKRLKRLFAKTGDNKWLGVAIGTVGTAAIQSSGAVTVMVIGFVNVGIMSLAQGKGNFFDGWMKNPMSAMISCNDGFRPFSFYIEVIDE